MSRSLDQRRYYARWSEPILRRRYPVQLAATSEEETSSIGRSRSSSPLLTMSHPPVPSLDPTIGCCFCRRRCNKKKSSKSHSTNDSKKSNGVRSGSQRMRENLELQLIGTQVEEALAGDRQTALIQHLDLATAALEALTQHVRSLQVSHMACYRVLDLTHRLILPYRTMTNHCDSACDDLITHLQQAEIRKENRLLALRNVVESCSKNVAVSKQLQSVMDDHRVRKEDFAVAARNLKNLLDSSKLTMAQMEKLDRQYEAILCDYQQSRRAVDVELPKIVRIRLGALCQSFRMIAEFYNDLEYGKQTADLFKMMGDKLCQDETCKAVDHLPYDQAQTQEICQKCKVNRIDKK